MAFRSQRSLAIQTKESLDQHRRATHQWTLPVHCGDQEQELAVLGGTMDSGGEEEIEEEKPMFWRLFVFVLFFLDLSEISRGVEK